MDLQTGAFLVAHTIPSELVTPHDRIPVYGHTYTICAVRSGAWSDVATWDQSRIPNKTDAVCVPVEYVVTIGGAAPPVTLEERVTDLERRVAALEAGGVAPPQTSGPAICLDLVIAGHLQLLDGGALTARTITVLPAGHLSAAGVGQILFRDLPIDTTYDANQYGHGLLVVDGRLTLEGIKKTAWVTLAAEIQAGDTTISLAAAPSGWLPGDVLVLPDTRQPTTTNFERWTEHVTVASVTGATVTLTAPVQYSHLGWHTQQGAAALLPDVGNVSRSLVLKSENSSGTRGHVLVTRRADVTARYVEIRGMGRTKSDPLNNTTRDAAGVVTHVGTNQIGRYAWHFHHCLGPLDSSKPYQFDATGLVVRDPLKWGMAIHGSHYGYVGHNIIDGVVGAGIVTESVHEYATVIEDNLIIGGLWGGRRITARSHRNDPNGDFWHSSVGLGLTSASCTIQRNHIYGCQEGIGMAGFRTTPTRWPKVRGADPMTDWITAPYDGTYRYQFFFPTDHNQVWGSWRGIETWTADSYPDAPAIYLDMFPDSTFVHCRTGTDFEDQRETTTKRWRFLGDFQQIGSGAVALDFKDGYEFGHTHIECVYRGLDASYSMASPNEYSRFIRCTFECAAIVTQPTGDGGRSSSPRWEGLWEACAFLPVNGTVTFIKGVPDTRWMVSTSHPGRKFLAAVDYKIRPWHDGRNLNVYHWYQAPSFALPAIQAPTAYVDFPPGIYTHAQLIALGTPIYGAVLPTDAEPFGPHFFAKEVPS